MLSRPASGRPIIVGAPPRSGRERQRMIRTHQPEPARGPGVNGKGALPPIRPGPDCIGAGPGRAEVCGS